MDENDPIYKAIDLGGGQTCDIEGVVRELGRAGYAIVPKEATIRMGRAGSERLLTSTYATEAQRMGDAWSAMIGGVGQEGRT